MATFAGTLMVPFTQVQLMKICAAAGFSAGAMAMGLLSAVAFVATSVARTQADAKMAKFFFIRHLFRWWNRVKSAHVSVARRQWVAQSSVPWF